MIRILSLFGTRPEVIKLAPVIRSFEELPELFTTVNVASAQHTSLLYPFAESLGVRIDHDLQVMRPGQTPNDVCARVMLAMRPILEETGPDVILVQGDTTTTLAGALAGFYGGIPVGHVEAGLRTNDPRSPFPEEMNRRLVTRLASFHFAATEHNRRTLIAEGVSDDAVHVTGNPVVDALHEILGRPRPGNAIDRCGIRHRGIAAHRFDDPPTGEPRSNHAREPGRFTTLRDRT